MACARSAPKQKFIFVTAKNNSFKAHFSMPFFDLKLSLFCFLLPKQLLFPQKIVALVLMRLTRGPSPLKPIRHPAPGVALVAPLSNFPAFRCELRFFGGGLRISKKNPMAKNVGNLIALG
jgi:hypothetical protein